MDNTTNIGENLFPGLGNNIGYSELLAVENRHHTNEFMRKFGETNFMALVGKCGHGKSFFLRNHFIPFIQNGYAKNGIEKWKILDLKKTRYPLTNLCNQLANLAKETAVEERVNPNLEADYYERMSTQAVALIDILQELNENEPFNVVLLADKLDEFFLEPLLQDELADKERLIFSNQITKAVNQKAFPIHFVCSIDEKNLPKIAAYESFYALITKNTHYFRPYTSENILSYLNKITEQFYVEVNENVVSELLEEYEGEKIVLAQLIQILRASYSNFIADEKAEATIEQQHVKPTGAMYFIFDKSFNESLKKLSSDDKKIVKKALSLLHHSDDFDYLFIKSSKVNEVAHLLEIEPSELIRVLSQLKINGESVYLTSQSSLVENRLEALNDGNISDQAIDTSELFIRSGILINHVAYFKKIAVEFEQDHQRLLEISHDVHHKEAYYRDEKLASVYIWFTKLWFTKSIGQLLIDNYGEVRKFIYDSFEEEQNRINKQKAEEQSRLAKERRFRITVIASAVLASIFVFLAIGSAKRLITIQQQNAAVEDSLDAQKKNLAIIQSRADSALRQVSLITAEFESKAAETKKKSLELEAANEDIKVQQENLKTIEESLKENLKRQSMMVAIQDSLEKEASKSIELANKAKNDAAFTSAINKINSTVFAGGQLIRNRNPLDDKALINAVQLGLNAYDSLKALRDKPYAFGVDPTRFVNTEKALYSHLTISYSQLNTSAVNKEFKPIKQSRHLSFNEASSNNVFIGTNTGELLRVNLNELETVTENTSVDRQPLPIANAQIRYNIHINDGKNTLVVLSDGRIVLFDFFYGTILDIYDDENVGSLYTTSPIYTTKEGSYLTLFKGNILEFIVNDKSKIELVKLSKIGKSTDNWLKFSFEKESDLAYVREDLKAISVYEKSRITGVFEKLEQKYFDELPSDISFIQSVESSNRIILGLQNGQLATILTSDEGKKLDRNTLAIKASDAHDNAIISMSLNQQKNLIATGGTDSRVLIWNIDSLFSRTTPLQFEREIFDIQAVHSSTFINNTSIVTASSAFKFDEINRDGQVVLWPLSVDSLAEKVRQLMQVNSIIPDNKSLIENIK